MTGQAGSVEGRLAGSQAKFFHLALGDPRLL